MCQMFSKCVTCFIFGVVSQSFGREFKYRNSLKSVTSSAVRSVFNILSDSEESLMRHEIFSVMNLTFLGVGPFCRPSGSSLSRGGSWFKIPLSS
jgi:hypothetical protein